MTNFKWWTEGKRHATTNTNTFTIFLYHTNTITWRWWTGEKPLSFRLRCPFPSPPQRPFSGEDGDHHLLYDNDDVEDKNDDHDQVLQRNGSSDPEPRGHPDDPLVQGEPCSQIHFFSSYFHWTSFSCFISSCFLWNNRIDKNSRGLIGRTFERDQQPFLLRWEKTKR